MATVDQEVDRILNETATDDPWREKYKRWWLQLRGLGWDAMMLDKIMRQNKIARDTARRTMDGTIGKPTEGGSSAEKEDMLRIGDEVHNHYPSSPVAQPTGMSTLGKVAIGTALAVGGAGVGLGLPAAIDAWSHRPAASSPDFTDTNTDTTVSVSIPEEDRLP